MTDNAIAAQTGQNEDEFASDDDQLPKETRIRHLKLYRAALNGNWDIAKGIYDNYNQDIAVGISKERDTALHIAAAAKHTNFVKELVKRMNEEDLAEKNNVGNTALCLAAASGKVELAKVMMEKNKALAMIRDRNEMLPLHMATSLGHKELVKFIYQETKDELDNEDRIELLVTLINTDLYEVALELLGDFPELATARDRNNETALHALARKPLASSNFANQNWGGILKRCFSLVSGAKYIDKKKLQQEAFELVERLWEQVILLSDLKISKLIGSPWQLIFVAAEQGNIEFLSILIREYPDLIWKVDEKQCSIFHVAVLNRQENIFNLIYQIGSIKDLIVMYEDKEKNNILHLAGMLAPPDRLNIVSGAALQMQREVLWFKEVSKVVQPLYAEAKNEEGLTPRALFTKKHENLREKGEKWMRSTASSCMPVATLIATVVFAAAFAVPGGDERDTGLPTRLEKVSFKIFAISDAISLVSASTSIINFLSILTSRYAEEDFIRLLPRKLLIGLATLVISIAAMMYRLFYDVLRSTYVSESLFQPSKTSLFHEEGKANERQKAKQPNGLTTISSNV
ncbi:Ankyrin repeat family protein [Melia azedarach]|uniref:Ankyrin repeat family protein n=1 Tax=Melia azedarach TaxID=155640 RepID=A0ACC1WTZ2_MELAZ|nr:Ankyrin repeat family protein [Melia azedarach]